MRSASLRRMAVLLLAPFALLLAAPGAHALPSYARQTGQECAACHNGFPELTPYGRLFKLNGYTFATGGSNLPPIAMMVIPSFTHTQAPQIGGAAPGFGDNNNVALTQLSLFYGGRLLGPYADSIFGKDIGAIFDKIGIFSQTTYDGIGKAWHWDNTDVRFVNTANIHDQTVIYGLYADNNPTMHDPWNSTPAWGFPFSGSGLSNTPAAGTLIEGGLSQQVAGFGAYAMVADSYYVDVGAYRTIGASLQRSLGIDPTGETQVTGLAPYWRLAVDRLVGDAHWEFGTFGLATESYPGRDSSAGTDKITDIGFDTQYQVSRGPHDLTAMLSWIYERQTWDASYALGNTSNTSDTLYSFKATVDYLYDKTYGAAVQYFLVDGSSDATLYSGSQTGSPTSDGFIVQLDYFPFNKGGGPKFWPKSNVKFSLQYVVYNRFNGARTNYDGMGSNAQDNNTLYLEAWIAF